MRIRGTATKPAFPECHRQGRHCASNSVSINSLKPYFSHFLLRKLSSREFKELAPKSHNHEEMAKMGLCICISFLGLL